MIKSFINISFCFLLAFSITDLTAQTQVRQSDKLTDAAPDPVVKNPDLKGISSYEKALQQWKGVSDVTTWIKNNFRYDMERAKLLSENSSSREKTHIYSPAELFQVRKGVCIDLTRFAVETINRLDTTKHVQYLMIEFEPVMIDSSILRKHWMGVYQTTAGYYFLADSKRPGHTAGPYNNVEQFITEYQAYRDRKIISWKVLVSYEKKRIKKVQRVQGS